jgi:hypothetical protein
MQASLGKIREEYFPEYIFEKTTEELPFLWRKEGFRILKLD